jgi:class 3 adenylate cyclase
MFDTLDEIKLHVVQPFALQEQLAIPFDRSERVPQVVGDGFMSIFNAPIEQPNHASLALQCARQIASLPGLESRVRFGVGVNTGFAMVGNVGSPRAMDYSAIGTTTNIAYRLQQLAGPGDALFGEKTRELAGDQVFHGSMAVMR